MLAGRRDPSRRVAIGRGSSRAHFLAIILIAIGFLDSFRFLDRKKSMQLCFSIADRHFFLVGPVSVWNLLAESVQTVKDENKFTFVLDLYWIANIQDTEVVIPLNSAV